MFSIIDFLGVCSRVELDWLIEESTKHLVQVLKNSSASSKKDATYDSNHSPVKIRVQRAQRHVVFPPANLPDSVQRAASFLAGLLIDCSNDAVFSNKASRMRSKIAAIIAVQSLHARLGNYVPKEDYHLLAAVRKLQQSFAMQHIVLPPDQVTMHASHPRSDGYPEDFLPLRPSIVERFSTTLPEAIVITRPARQPVKASEEPLSTLVIPSAGRSSRFPGHKPKWLLTMPNGRLMVVDALAKLDLSRVKRVVLGVLKEHVETHCKSDINALLRAFEDGPAQLSVIELSIVIISKETVDQVQTIQCILRTANVTGPIYIKDCDNQFASSIPGVDGVATLEITREMQNIDVPAGKSYITFDENGNIDNIVEKVILGPNFCVGGYSFGCAADFMQLVNNARFYQTIACASKIELAVSDIVWLKLASTYCLREDIDVAHPTSAVLISPGMCPWDIPPSTLSTLEVSAPLKAPAEFVAIPVTSYSDWGTLPSFRAYASTFRTLFLDIDGTLLRNSGAYFPPNWGKQPALPSSVAHLQKLHAAGRTQIILTTSRTEAFRDVTEKQLQEYGVPYDQIVFGMFHARRVLVNDFAKTNPYPSAEAVNLRRDGDELAEILDGL